MEICNLFTKENKSRESKHRKKIREEGKVQLDRKGGKKQERSLGQKEVGRITNDGLKTKNESPNVCSKAHKKRGKR